MSETKPTPTPPLAPRPVKHEILPGAAVVFPPDEVRGFAQRAGVLHQDNPGPVWLRQRITSSADGARGQGYTLTISADAAGCPLAEIESPTAVGLRNGRETLLQLLTASGCRPAPCRIEDAPAYAVRGVMLDVSRCRIPTMREFREIIRTLASLKINHLQLYTEHTFAYPGREAIWRGWSPITPDEVRRIDGWCAERGITLAANQNCFGHLRHWLEHPGYQHLAETHGDWFFDVWPRSGPFSLCPTDPASLGFIGGLLRDLLPCFTSDLVNIGCDETYDIAYGRSAAAVKAEGRGTVFARFVAKIAEAAASHKKRPMFWADIALSHPECLALLPRSMIALAWGYEPDSPFDRWGEALSRTGLEHWVCPGTSSWRTFAGRPMERDANIFAAAAAGLRHGARGMLVCDWGDTGHSQPWPVAMLGIARGGAAAWNPSEPADKAGLDAAWLHGLDDSAIGCAHWLDELGQADAGLRATCLGLSRPGKSGVLRNQSALFIDMLTPWRSGQDVGSPGDWADALERVRALAGQRPASGRPLLDDELAHTAEFAEFAAYRACARRGLCTPAQGALRERCSAILDGHARLWRSRSREGGLAQSLRTLGAVETGAPPA